jgi:hypothetical protein
VTVIDTGFADIISHTSRGLGVDWTMFDLDQPGICEMAAWCSGIHDPEDMEHLRDLDWLAHGRDVARAFDDGEPVIEISVGQMKALRRWRLGGSSMHPIRDEKPGIWVFTYPEDGTRGRGMFFEQWQYAEGLASVAHLCAADGLADALERAANLAKRIADGAPGVMGRA